MGKGGHLEAPGHGVGHHTGKWQRGGLIRTAAAHRSRWVSWDRGVVEEFRGGDGKWGALGGIFFLLMAVLGTRIGLFW